MLSAPARPWRFAEAAGAAKRAFRLPERTTPTRAVTGDR